VFLLSFILILFFFLRYGFTVFHADFELAMYPKLLLKTHDLWGREGGGGGEGGEEWPKQCMHM
jgi:hypothetical protein